MKNQIKNGLYFAKLLIKENINLLVLDNKKDTNFADYYRREEVFAVVVPSSKFSILSKRYNSTSGIEAGSVTPFFRDIKDLLVYMRHNTPENYMKVGLELPDKLDGVDGHFEPMFMDNNGNLQVSRGFCCGSVIYKKLNRAQKNIAEDGLCAIVNDGRYNKETK